MKIIGCLMHQTGSYLNVWIVLYGHKAIINFEPSADDDHEKLKKTIV